MLRRAVGRVLFWGGLLALAAVLAGLLVGRVGRPADPDRRHRPPTVACPPGGTVERSGSTAPADTAPADTAPADTGPLTPYPASAPVAEFVQGASLELEGVRAQDVPGLLRSMRTRHHINTMSVYGLERWDAPGRHAAKDVLFAELARQSMMIVIRLEAYDPDTFAFTAGDAAAVLDRHRELLRYVSAPQRRGRLAYVSLTMPVDDPAVQRRLGGVDAPLSVQRQPAYADALVRGVRDTLPGVRVYLGLFYGWDGGYDVPSYAVAGADGYVLTNYSYPVDAVPGVAAADEDLINEARLRIAVDRAVAQYGDRVPLVVEYGFHTAARHGDPTPDQRAGLVADVAAKRRALRATNRFYCAAYPNVVGTMYFGFNIVTREGNPPALLDFALSPPAGSPPAGSPPAGSPPTA